MYPCVAGTGILVAKVSTMISAIMSAVRIIVRIFLISLSCNDILKTPFFSIYILVPKC